MGHLLNNAISVETGYRLEVIIGIIIGILIILAIIILTIIKKLKDK